MTNDFQNSFVDEFDLFGPEAVALGLFRYEVAFGDSELLAFGVTGETQYLETILQRRRDRVQHVGSGDEESSRQIVLDIEIVILEGVVLFRIEHFEQRGTRIAAEVSPELVYLVEQDHRIHGAGLLHHLNDLPRQRADIGAAMSADLSFVANAAE